VDALPFRRRQRQRQRQHVELLNELVQDRSPLRDPLRAFVDFCSLCYCSQVLGIEAAPVILQTIFRAFGNCLSPPSSSAV